MILMFFTTLTGQLLPLLMTVCLPLIFFLSGRSVGDQEMLRFSAGPAPQELEPLVLAQFPVTSIADSDFSTEGILPPAHIPIPGVEGIFRFVLPELAHHRAPWRLTHPGNKAPPFIT